MKLTPQQQAVVDHRRGALVVAASAGSGKTEVLARRCAALVADAGRPCGVEQLLVVTFTRAAAAEMRVRIARELRKAAGAIADRMSRARLRREVMLIDAADITTIDAWCARLVRRTAVDIGIDPAFTELSPEDAAILRARTLDDQLNALYASDEPLAIQLRALLARHASAGDDFLREMVVALNAYREHVVNPHAWLGAIDARCAAPDPLPVLAGALARECAFQHEQLAVYDRTANAAALAPYRAALADWDRRLRQSPESLRTVADEIAAAELLPAPKSKSTAPSSVPEQIHKHWLEKRLRDRWTPDLIAEWIAGAAGAASVLRLIRAIEQRYADALAEAKRRDATCEFADVQRLALDLLGRDAGGQTREPTRLALALRRRYEHVLVDECQDTSPVQMELLRLVSRPAPAGNRLLVGDVKQSIYGFRQAEPELFVRQVAALRSDPALGDVLPLADNFRTHADVLAPLNELFGRLFDPALGGTPFGDDERIHAARGEIDNPTLTGRPRIELHIVEESDPQRGGAGDDDVQDVELIEREAQLAAERIQQLLASGVQIPERTPDGGLRLRALAPGDIAILLRKARGHATHIARVLRANNLRCVTAGRDTLLDSLEALDVINVLRLLANRRHDVALAAYLRGPMVGLAPDELLRVRAAAPRSADFLDAVEAFAGLEDEASTALVSRVRGALVQLDRWATLAREVDVATLVRRVIQDADHVLFTLGLRGGAQRVAVVEALQTLAVAFDQPAAGVGEFVAQLDALEAAEQLGAAPTASDDNAIRILTIHGSKGLEFPVVFVLGAGTKFNPMSSRRRLMCDGELGAGLKWYDADARQTLESAEHVLIGRRTREREVEEELRLLYVAATRARELLFFFGTPADERWASLQRECAGRPTIPLIARLGAERHLDWLIMALASAALPATLVKIETHASADVKVARFANLPEPASRLELDDDDARWVADGLAHIEAASAPAPAQRPAVLSVSALKRRAAPDPAEDRTATSAVVQLEHGEPPLSTPGFAATLPEPDGRAYGTAFHRLMQFADLARLGAPGEEAARLVAGGVLSRDETALLNVDDVAWLATTDVGRLLARHAARLERELAFVLAAPVEHDDHMIIRGVVDALISTDDGLVLVDYKTDRPRDAADLEQRVAMYTRQVQLYAAAVGQITGVRIARCLLAFVRVRRVVEVAPDAAALHDIAGPLTSV